MHSVMVEVGGSVGGSGGNPYYPITRHSTLLSLLIVSLAPLMYMSVEVCLTHSIIAKTGDRYDVWIVASLITLSAMDAYLTAYVCMYI